MQDEFERYAVNLLYAFPVNLMRLSETISEYRALQQETDCHAQRYDRPQTSEGQHSDPVNDYSERLSRYEERIKILREKTTPVLIVRDQLKNSRIEEYRELFLVMEFHFFEKQDIKTISRHLGVSERTLGRRRQKLVEFVANVLAGSVV